MNLLLNQINPGLCWSLTKNVPSKVVEGALSYFGGTQVMGASGNMASGHRDPNFPAFLPMMQFSGQHPGGIGVPVVGMAYPGYVGRGNFDMTCFRWCCWSTGSEISAYCC